MPKIKRWFPVNHNINRDPEVWAMRRLIGEKSLSIWLEFLSIADQNEGEIPGQLDLLMRSVSGTCQATVRTVTAVYQYAITKVWLASEPTLHVVKYANYHRSRERINPLLGSLLTRPSEPSEPISEYYKNNILPGIVTQEQLRTGKTHAPKVVKLWPEEDLWLKQFLEKQTYLNNSTGSLLAYDWWEDVAAVLGGIDRTFIERQFAKIGAWLKENPGRRPTAKGARRFLRSWLERARDQERRLYAVKR
jgi:hypothetical protein